LSPPGRSVGGRRIEGVLNELLRRDINLIPLVKNVMVHLLVCDLQLGVGDLPLNIRCICLAPSNTRLEETKTNVTLAAVTAAMTVVAALSLSRKTATLATTRARRVTSVLQHVRAPMHSRPLQRFSFRSRDH